MPNLPYPKQYKRSKRMPEMWIVRLIHEMWLFHPPRLPHNCLLSCLLFDWFFIHSACCHIKSIYCSFVSMEQTLYSRTQWVYVKYSQAMISPACCLNSFPPSAASPGLEKCVGKREEEEGKGWDWQLTHMALFLTRKSLNVPETPSFVRWLKHILLESRNHILYKATKQTIGPRKKDHSNSQNRSARGTRKEKSLVTTTPPHHQKRKQQKSTNPQHVLFFSLRKSSHREMKSPQLMLIECIALIICIFKCIQ